MYCLVFAAFTWVRRIPGRRTARPVVEGCCDGGEVGGGVIQRSTTSLAAVFAISICSTGRRFSRDPQTFDKLTIFFFLLRFISWVVQTEKQSNTPFVLCLVCFVVYFIRCRDMIVVRFCVSMSVSLSVLLICIIRLRRAPTSEMLIWVAARTLFHRNRNRKC